MGIDDKPPTYLSTIDHKSPPIDLPSEDATHTIWLTFKGDSAPDGPLTIVLASSSTFLDFQSKIKQRYLETRSEAADRIAFIWSTFLVETPPSASDIASARDAADGIYLDEHNWATLKPTILNISHSETAFEKLRKKKRLSRIDAAASSDTAVARLIVSFCDVDWTERRAAKKPEMLERQQKAHERNERSFLLQGRHCPPPTMSTCVVM